MELEDRWYSIYNRCIRKFQSKSERREKQMLKSSLTLPSPHSLPLWPCVCFVIELLSLSSVSVGSASEKRATNYSRVIQYPLLKRSQQSHSSHHARRFYSIYGYVSSFNKEWLTDSCNRIVQETLDTRHARTFYKSDVLSYFQSNIH